MICGYLHKMMTRTGLYDPVVRYRVNDPKWNWVGLESATLHLELDTLASDLAARVATLPEGVAVKHDTKPKSPPPHWAQPMFTGSQGATKIQLPDVERERLQNADRDTLKGVVIRHAAVVCTPLDSVNDAILQQNGPFSLLLVDDSSTGTETSASAALSSAARVVMFGDHRMGMNPIPMLDSGEIDELYDGPVLPSLYNRLMRERNTPTVKLDTQHRMHPGLYAGINHRYYNNEVQTGSRIGTIDDWVKFHVISPNLNIVKPKVDEAKPHLRQTEPIAIAFESSGTSRKTPPTSPPAESQSAVTRLVEAPTHTASISAAVARVKSTSEASKAAMAEHMAAVDELNKLMAELKV
jgi:hypothetical protein